MIEYTLIAVLVILGIVLMGPYVLRSVNAHFKIWDDGVKDSFEEHLTQAPVNSVPPINVTCRCPVSKGSCGGSNNGGTGSCATNQREYDYNCDPPGCNGAQQNFYCQDDDQDCCSAWVPAGCGLTPIGQVPPPTDCNYGFEKQAHQCGNTNVIQCTQDPSCDPQCKGNYPADPTVNLFCANNSTTAPNSGLTQDTNISYVANQAGCPSSPTCQMYCVAPNVLNQTMTACVPPAAASLPSCSFFCANPANNPLAGSWTGKYEDVIPALNSGQFLAFLSVTCGSNDRLTGICLNGVSTSNLSRGFSTASICPGLSPTPGSMFCNWGGIEVITTSNAQRSFSLNCINSQIVSINFNSNPIVANAQCNWSGEQDVEDLGSGNDMFLTCTNGNITQFQYGPQAPSFTTGCRS